MLKYLELILAMLVVASALISLVDVFFFEKARKAKAKAEPGFNLLSEEEQAKRLKPPFFADYARSLFGVLLLVFCLRSFLAEPFRIPSASLLPTLLVGDWIVLSKFSYGEYTPVWRHLLFKTGDIHRGDIVVFRYPVNSEADLIKRVIGLPGDTISYVNKQLIINGKPVPLTLEGSYEGSGMSANPGGLKYREDLLGVSHEVLMNPTMKSVDFKGLVVPAGEYFVMGDNRDNSADSRYWGFVPRDHILGKAQFIVWSWNDHYAPRFDRIGKVIH